MLHIFHLHISQTMALTEKQKTMTKGTYHTCKVNIKHKLICINMNQKILDY